MSIISSFTAIKSEVDNLSKGKSLLTVVTKQQSLQDILPILESGHLFFGENRVQEAYQKWPALKVRYPDIELHLIGPLQTNKVKDAVKLFDVIETVDRPNLAEKLAHELKNTEKKISCYVQVNIGEEPQKTGILPLEAPSFIDYCQQDLQLPIKGLMCIPPINEEPAPYFGLLKTIAERHKLPVKSMGMTSDFQIAIALGATHVRIGSAIFGPRSN